MIDMREKGQRERRLDLVDESRRSIMHHASTCRHRENGRRPKVFCAPQIRRNASPMFGQERERGWIRTAHWTLYQRLCILTTVIVDSLLYCSDNTMTTCGKGTEPASSLTRNVMLEGLPDAG